MDLLFNKSVKEKHNWVRPHVIYPHKGNNFEKEETEQQKVKCYSITNLDNKDQFYF